MKASSGFRGVARGVSGGIFRDIHRGPSPRSRAGLRQTWIVGLGLGAMVMFVPAATTAAEPPAASAQDVAERVFFDRLRDLLREKQWADASRHIHQLQAIRPPPGWLGAREGEIRLAQVRIGQAQRDFPVMVAAARLFLNGDDARARQLIELARENHAAGDKAVAIALAKEVVDRSPGFTMAQQLLSEWEPPVPKKKMRAEEKTLTETTALPEKKTSPPEDDEATAQLARLRASQAQGNVPGMLAAARLFLTGDRARSFKMLEVAREYFDRGDKSTAVALTTEVLRRTPGFPPAQRLLAAMDGAEKK
jgi:hypothetical protein